MKPIYLLFCCFFLTNILYAQKNQFGNNSKAGKYYFVRGIRLYTEEYGKGKPLLLLHGNGGSISSMSDIIPYFSKNYRTIVLDSRAHGKSIDSGERILVYMDLAKKIWEQKEKYFISFYKNSKK